MTFIPAQFASRVVRTIGVTSLALLSLQALAQEVYPNRPVVVISPWPAGGPAEAIIRPIAEKLTQRLGQQFVVDSKGGANGTIGSALVARAKSDGYTLLFSHVGPIAISPSMPNKPPYDPIKDFAPITQIASGLGGAFRFSREKSQGISGLCQEQPRQSFVRICGHR